MSWEKQQTVFASHSQQVKSVANNVSQTGKATRRERQDGDNLRANWLVNKAKVEPKTVQGILRHARIQTTPISTQEDADETRAAQGEYLMALGVATETVQ